MNILHTSDWHLGQNLMFKDRKDEHQAFLEWLIGIIKEENINLLIIAGDVFDTGNPPNYALKMYYKFLVEVSLIKTCHDIVIIGGNHDSVSTLNAPRELLSFINVSVIGGITDNIRDEIIYIKDEKKEAGAIVCAVPFLRERDIRKSLAGESYQEKSRELMLGIKNHYKKVYEEALAVKKELNLKEIPIIATGHLFTAGGMISDGIRDIYVGNLGKFEKNSFPKGFDYIALGHLHKPQIVDKDEFVRFSGSPIPLSFGEAVKQKEVVKISFPDKKLKIIKIPIFKKLLTFEGSLEEIKSKILDLKEANEEIWLEIYVKNDNWKYDLVKEINTYVENTNLVIFKISRLSNGKNILTKDNELIDLSNCSVFDVFQKRLDISNEIDEDSKSELKNMFNEVYNEIHEDDSEN